MSAKEFSRQRGFTLVEVMVAFFVLAVGLLGMASLLTQSVRGNQSAMYRSQAVMLASEMADRIRANPGVAYQSIAAALDGDRCFRGEAVEGATACGPETMAANDVAEWNEALATLLPGGVGVICLDNSPNDGHSNTSNGCTGNGLLTVKVWWDANPRDGAITSTDPRTVLVVR